MLFVALDPDDAAARHRMSHRTRELAQTRTEVDDVLIAAERHLAERRVIEQDVVEKRQPSLLFGRCPVDVDGFAHVIEFIPTLSAAKGEGSPVEQRSARNTR